MPSSCKKVEVMLFQSRDVKLEIGQQWVKLTVEG